MRGTVSRIYENQLEDGRVYWAALINGHRYTVWDPNIREALQEGKEVDYVWKEAGDSKRIVQAQTVDGSPDDVGQAHDPRGTRIVRMACLKYATSVLAEPDHDSLARADTTLQIARRFEEYVLSPVGRLSDDNDRKASRDGEELASS